MVKRLLNKVSSETSSGFIPPKMDLDAKSMGTRMWQGSHSSSKMEQQSVKPGNEENGSLYCEELHRTYQGMRKRQQRLKFHRIDCMWYRVIIAMRRWKLNGIWRSLVQDGTSRLWRPTEYPGALCKRVHGAWPFCKLNGVFREAELIQLECYYLEIHLYQLFFEVIL